MRACIGGALPARCGGALRRGVVETIERRIMLAGDFGFADAFGGPSAEAGRDAVTDAAGNVYVTGTYRGTAPIDFDPGAAAANLTSPSGATSQFVAKYTPTNTLVWVKGLIGTNNNFGAGNNTNALVGGIALDPAGNVLVTGSFVGTADFDPGAGVFNLTSNGSSSAADPFVLKLTNAGAFLWAKRMGGPSSDIATGIASDSAGNVLVCGFLSASGDFDPGPGVTTLTSHGSNDAYVVKLNSAGNLVYAESWGGSSNDFATGIATDAAGNAIVGGAVFTPTTDFDPGPGVVLKIHGPSFIMKLSPTGTFIWANTFATGSNSAVFDLVTDASSNIYATGQFFGPNVDFDPGPGVHTLSTTGNVANEDVFVLKLTSAGAFGWADRMGTPSISDGGYGISLDTAGEVYVTGYFGGSGDFDPGAGVLTLTSTGLHDIFAEKLTNSGALIWAHSAGAASSQDQGNAIAAAPDGNAVFITGHFSTTVDFDPSAAGFANRTSHGGDDAFLWELDDAVTAPFGFAGRVGGKGDDQALGVASDAAGNMYVTGFFSGVVDFDPGPAIANLGGPAGGAFAAKYSPSGALIWARALANGVAGQVGRAIAVDANGDVYVTGQFRGTVDFAGGGVALLTSTPGGAADGFVWKLDGTNGHWISSWRLGGAGPVNVTPNAIAVDAGGNIFVGGSFTATVDFDPDPRAAFVHNVASHGSTDGFVLKLGSLGAFRWVATVGAAGADTTRALALDRSGNVYSTGHFESTVDFNPSAAATLNLVGSNSSYIWKLTSAGALGYARAFKGAGTFGIAVDVSANVYAAMSVGTTPVDFDPGVGINNIASAGGTDVVIEKLNSAGNFVFAKRIGGAGNGVPAGITLDAGGNVYVTGTFTNTVDFDPGPGVTTLTSAGGSDVFVLKLTSAGAFTKAYRLGGSSQDTATGIAIGGPLHAIYITGFFIKSGDYDPTASVLTLTSAGGTDVFLSKIVQ